MIKNVHGNTVDHLGEAIVAGRYATGASIPPEAALCLELGVSRTVVREAVKSLIAKGLMTTGPKVGARVLACEHWNWFDADVIAWQCKAGLTAELLRDLHDLRRVVEPAATRLSAERATASDIAEIELAYAGMKSAVETGGDYVSHDLRFHQGLLRACGNRMLTQMSKALAAALHAGFEISTRCEDGAKNSLALHREVLDAVIAHDPDRAEKAVRQLIDGAWRDARQAQGWRGPPQSRQPARRLATA